MGQMDGSIGMLREAEQTRKNLSKHSTGKLSKKGRFKPDSPDEVRLEIRRLAIGGQGCTVKGTYFSRNGMSIGNCTKTETVRPKKVNSSWLEVGDLTVTFDKTRSI